MTSRPVVVVGAFDDLRWARVARLQRIAGPRPVTVGLLSDDLAERRSGARPRFGMDERRYFVGALRRVEAVADVWDEASLSALTEREGSDGWIDLDDAAAGPGGEVDEATDRWIAPDWSVASGQCARPFVVVTGCYDWLHTGHVRFFEEAAQIGALFVTVGSDESIASHKGDGHPRIGQNERVAMAGAIRHVSAVQVASGSGWLDAEADIRALKPDYWLVNEDGDRPEKRELCAELGIRLRVSRREPKAGLPRRSSTDLGASETGRDFD